MAAVYALNLFDLADNDDYRAYSKRSRDAVGKHGGSVVALGRLAGAAEGGDTEPRQVMVLVEWPSRAAFDAFLNDPDHARPAPAARERHRALPVVALRPPRGPAPAAPQARVS